MPGIIVLLIALSPGLDDAKPAVAAQEVRSSPPRERSAWWFPTTARPGDEFHYHATYDETAIPGMTGARSRRLEANFAILTKLTDGGQLRFCYVPGSFDRDRAPHDLTLWGQVLANLQGEGLDVTDNEVRMAGGPLLRGPWRSGDRLTVAWGMFLLRVTGGIIHLEVDEAGPQTLKLSGEIWGGPFLPDWVGNGSVKATSDDRGIVDVAASWSWTFGQDELKAALVVKRTKVIPAAPIRKREARRKSGPIRSIELGSLTSFQVNVDEDGNNIIGDAANQPSMAVDPTHRRRIVIGWQQFNSVTSNFRQAGFSYSRDGGETWQPAGVLHPGTYRTEPVLAAGEHGRMYYGSVQGNLRGDLFASNDGGASWNMLGDVCEGAKLWLVVDRRPDVRPDGMCAVAVTPRDGSADVRFTCSTNRGQSFSDPIVIIPKASQAALTVGPDGTVYVAAATGETFQFSSTDDALASKVVPHFGSSSLVDLGGPPVYGVGPNPGGALGRPWIAANHSRGPNRGDLYLLSSIDPSGPDPLDVMFVRSSDGGKSWTTPVRVNDDSPEGCAWQWFGTLSVAPKGRIDAVWNDTRHASAGYSSGLFYSYSVDGGTSWSSNTAVSPAWDPHVGWPQTNTIGDRHHVVSDDTGLYIAYTATFNGEQDIYFVRVPAVLP